MEQQQKLITIIEEDNKFAKKPNHIRKTVITIFIFIFLKKVFCSYYSIFILKTKLNQVPAQS
jgi:hypothetical protein